MKQPQQPDPFTDQSAALYKAVFSREPSVLERCHRLESHPQPGVLSHVKTASNRLAGVAQAVFTLGQRFHTSAPRVLTQSRQAKGLKTYVMAIVMAIVMLPFVQLALPSVTNSVASFLVRVLTPNAWVESLYAKQQCAERLPVVDARGQLLDVTDSVCGLPSAEKPHFITAPMTQAEASRYARFLEVVEGDHRVRWNTFLGVDLKGLGRAVFALIRSQARVGGSNGLQTAIKNLDTNLDTKVGGIGWDEKIAYLARTSLAGAYMDNDARDMFVAMNLPPITTRNPTYGAPLAGGLVPFLFGETRVSDLSDGQLCLLAAALKRQLIVTGRNTTEVQQRFADQRNTGVKARAKTRCVDKLSLTAPQVTEAYADIDAVQLTVSALGDEPRLGSNARLMDMDPGLRGFLSDSHKLERQLTTTLSGDTQRAFHQRLIGWGEGVTLRDATLCLPWLSCREGQRSVDMLAVVLEGKGPQQQMRLGYSTSELWNSGNRSLGSLPKILAGGMAIAQGQASTTFCRRRALGLHDGDFAGFDDCSDAGAQLSLEQLIGQSSNLAYVELIDALGGAERVAGYYDALGLHVASREEYPTPDEFRWALGVGVGVTGSPQNAVRAFSALVQAAEDKPPVAYQIEAISSASHPIDLSNIISGDITKIASHATQLKGALREGGTLQALAPALEARGCAIERSYAKTGTTQAMNKEDRRRVRDRFILLSTECSGKRFTAITMVGSPNMASSTDGISGADLRKIMLNALDAVFEK